MEEEDYEYGYDEEFNEEKTTSELEEWENTDNANRYRDWQFDNRKIC